MDCRYCRSLALIFVIGKFIAKPYTIKGDSMDPTLKDSQRVMVNIIGYKIGGVKKVTSLFSR